MLIENTLFGNYNKIKNAIEVLKDFEKKAIEINPHGYLLADSGGKDSCVINHLTKIAGVKHIANYNLTTVDPPELLQFIKKYHPDTIISRPEISMYHLIIKKMMPPTRICRYCCDHLKERHGKNTIIITGIRQKESLRRSKRKLFETCLRDSSKLYLNPIINWSIDEVWEYIKMNNIPYCKLYDEGFSRIGCIGCPMTSRERRLFEFKRYPKYEHMYRTAFDKVVKNRNKSDKKYKGNYIKWKTSDDMFNWWMNDIHQKENEDQYLIFG